MTVQQIAIDREPRPLAELETIIEHGLQTFVEVGEALLEIRERRLYRETHDSFEAYCQDRWHWTRGRANQMIRASEVAGLLDTTVSSERHARELGRLNSDPQGMREVWDEVRAEHGDDVTAANVRAAVDRRMLREREEEILEQVPDPGDAHRNAKIKRAYSSSVLQVMQGFMTIDPGFTVGLLSRDERADLRRFFDLFREQADRWEAAMRQGIHVIKPTEGQPVVDAEPLTERQSFLVNAIQDAAHLLEEPEHEKVFYTLSRFRLRMHVDPRDVAEVSHAPAQDAPSWAALAAWVGAIAEAVQARANGLRLLDDRQS